MKISFCNNYLSYKNNFSFKAKNKDTKKADDIMRNSKNVFPMISPSYISAFYKTADNLKVRKYLKDICNEKMKYVRDGKLYDRHEYTLLKDVEYTPLLMDLMERIKNAKIGNCKEECYAILCGLFANDCYKSAIAAPMIKTKIINKSNGETVFENSKFIDHSFVVSNMKNEKRNNISKVLVIDPWLNYTGEIKDAFVLYKRIYSDEIKKIILDGEKQVEQKMLKEGKTYDKKDFLCRTKFSYGISCLIPISELEEFKKEVLKFYSDLKLK